MNYPEARKIVIEHIRNELKTKGKVIVLGLGTFKVMPAMNRPFNKEKKRFKNRLKFNESLNTRHFLG